MSPVILTRHAYLPTVTLGWLYYAGKSFATLERPWIPAQGHKGGTVRESCIPDGTYALRNHTSERFRNVWALTNEALDVHYMPASKGRSAILIHAGNCVRDVVGCVALGLSHGTLEGEHAVLNSLAAIIEFRAALAGATPTVIIRPTTGTSNGTPWSKP